MFLKIFLTTSRPFDRSAIWPFGLAVAGIGHDSFAIAWISLSSMGRVMIVFYANIMANFVCNGLKLTNWIKEIETILMLFLDIPMYCQGISSQIRPTTQPLPLLAGWDTLVESENERQKIEPVPIPLPRASRNFPDVKTRNEIFFDNWTSEIIPFICFGMQMDWT